MKIIELAGEALIPQIPVQVIEDFDGDPAIYVFGDFRFSKGKSANVDIQFIRDVFEEGMKEGKKQKGREIKKALGI